MKQSYINKTKIKTTSKRLFLNSLLFIHNYSNTSTSKKDFTLLVKAMLTLFTKWEATKGSNWTIGRIKLLRHLAIRFLGDSPVKILRDEIIGLDKRGFPKALKPMEPLLQSRHRDDRRLFFSILQWSKFIKGKHPEPDYSPIVTPGIDNQYLITEFRESLPRLLKWINCSHIDLTWVAPHRTAKSGPMGQAMVSSLPEAKALSEGMRRDLSILASNPEFDQWLDEVSRIPPEHYGKIFDESKSRSKLRDRLDNPILRKLSTIEDPELKTRVIAIFDYWSQTALKPLHEKLMRNLRKIPSDCTHDQSKFTQLVIPPTGEYSSFDLKSATDRLPVSLQEVVLSAILDDPRKASAWRRILCDHEFSVPKSETTVKYAVGQPMGAYSSWPMMAMTHHLIVQFAAKRAGHSRYFKHYWLLGDDIVIKSSSVAKQYQLVMSSLGVEISKLKTIRSSTLFEFAKRIFHRGEEISHWPVKAIADSANSKYYMLAATLIPLALRGYLHHKGGEVPILTSGAKVLYKGILPPSRAARIFKRINAALTVNALLNNYVNDPNKVNKSEVLSLSLNFHWLATGHHSCNKPYQTVELVRSAVGAVLFQMTESQISKVWEEISNLKSKILEVIHSMNLEVFPGQGRYTLNSVPPLKLKEMEFAKLQELKGELVQARLVDEDWGKVIDLAKGLVLLNPIGLQSKRTHHVISGTVCKATKLSMDVYSAELRTQDTSQWDLLYSQLESMYGHMPDWEQQLTM